MPHATTANNTITTTIDNNNKARTSLEDLDGLRHTSTHQLLQAVRRVEFHGRLGRVGLDAPDEVGCAVLQEQHQLVQLATELARLRNKTPPSNRQHNHATV